MSENNIDISIIIPVKNGAKTLEYCLQAIVAQTIIHRAEIIIIDSGSTDNSVAIARKFGAKVINVPSESFNHGLTRNLGVEHSQGEFIVMLVQDAIPTSSFWLEKLISHLEQDNEIAGVCGMQAVPHDSNKNPAQWFRPVSNAQVLKFRYNIEEFNSFSALETRKICAWDNVNSAYRREILLDIPFHKIDFGEDMQWAKETLGKGKTIVYDPNARVYHYHHENFRSAFKRQFITMYFEKRIFNLVTSPPNIAKLFANKLYIIFKFKNIHNKIYWIFYNIRLCLALWLSQTIFWILSKLQSDKLINFCYKQYINQIPIGNETLKDRVQFKKTKK